MVNEVRKLSEQTKKSVATIKTFTDQITRHKDYAVQSIQSVEQMTNEGQQKSKITQIVFDRIVQAANENLALVQQTDFENKNLVHGITEIGIVTEKTVYSAEKLNQAALFS